MSFDIYGNNLQRGHCEVHPNIAEEYPCSLCQSHSQFQSQEADTTCEVQSLQNDLAQSNSYIDSLRAELAKVTAERDEYIKFHTENLTLIAWIARETVSVKIDGNIKARFHFYLAKRDLEQQAKGISDLNNMLAILREVPSSRAMQERYDELRKQANEVGK